MAFAELGSRPPLQAIVSSANEVNYRSNLRLNSKLRKRGGETLTKNKMIILVFVSIGLLLILTYKFINDPQISYIIGMVSTSIIFYIKKREYNKDRKQYN